MYVFMLDKDKGLTTGHLYMSQKESAWGRKTDRKIQSKTKVLHQPTSTKLNVQCNSVTQLPAVPPTPLPVCSVHNVTQLPAVPPTPLPVCSVHKDWVWDSAHPYPTACLFCLRKLGVRQCSPLPHCLSVLSTKTGCETAPLPHCLSVLSTQTGCDSAHPYPTACLFCLHKLGVRQHPYPTASLFCLHKLGVRQHPYPTACLFCPQRLGVRQHSPLPHHLSVLSTKTGCETEPLPHRLSVLSTDWVCRQYPYPTACLFCLYRLGVRQHPYPTACLFRLHRLGVRQHSPLPHCLSLSTQTGCETALTPTPLPVSVHTDWVWDSTHPYPTAYLFCPQTGREIAPPPHLLCLSLVYKDWVCSPPTPPPVCSAYTDWVWDNTLHPHCLSVQSTNCEPPPPPPVSAYPVYTSCMRYKVQPPR